MDASGGAALGQGAAEPLALSQVVGPVEQPVVVVVLQLSRGGAHTRLLRRLEGGAVAFNDPLSRNCSTCPAWIRILAQPPFMVGLQMNDGTPRSGLLHSMWSHSPQNSRPASG